MKKRDSYLIYDASCDFCTGLANYFKRKWKIRIAPNTMEYPPYDRQLISKDVHYECFDKESGEYRLFSGPAAAVRVVGEKYPLIIKVYSIIGFKQIIQALYWILKKSRKHLGNLF